MSSLTLVESFRFYLKSGLSFQLMFFESGSGIEILKDM
jgi:hypothetical protein